MKYKAMVLLEELIDHFNPERNYKIYFTLDFKDKCTGEFRKTKERLKKGAYVDIDSAQLVRDFESYINEYEENRQNTIELFTHLQSDAEYKDEKLANFFLATMAAFLEDEETDFGAYLIGYDGPEIIYHFTSQEGYQEAFNLDGREVELLSLYDFSLDEGN
ncbi:MAG TPA: hypothetical protein DCO62_01065 [Alkalibacterium sp.]|nr:hypothetical protein [Alkalibacterium sp.]